MLPPTAFFSPVYSMYILYLDESGTHGTASHFVLAGLAVFEREIHWYGLDLDALQNEYFPGISEPVYFHAAKLHTRSGDVVDPPWDGLSTEQRRSLKQRVYDVLRTRRGVLFACAVERAYAAAKNEDPYERAFEDLMSRFDMFMGKVNRLATTEGREEQRGLVVLAESSYEKTIALLARRLKGQGTRWGILHNVTDIPLFAPAHESRLLQYADFVANAIYGRYHAGLSGDFDKIAGKFDQEGNVLHGLAHLTRDYQCACLACFSRRGKPQQLSLPAGSP